MRHTLNSDNICVYLNPSETRLSLLIGGKADEGRPLSRSALQNPELSRHELDGLLRRTGKPERMNGWTSFFAGTAASCANANETAE